MIEFEAANNSCYFREKSFCFGVGVRQPTSLCEMLLLAFHVNGLCQLQSFGAIHISLLNENTFYVGHTLPVVEFLLTVWYIDVCFNTAILCTSLK